MKRLLMILATVACFSLSSYANQIYCGGELVGYSYASVTPDGYLMLTNSSNRTINVTVSSGNRTATFSVPPTTHVRSHNAGRVASSQVDVSIIRITCN